MLQKRVSAGKGADKPVVFRRILDCGWMGGGSFNRCLCLTPISRGEDRGNFSLPRHEWSGRGERRKAKPIFPRQKMNAHFDNIALRIYYTQAGPLEQQNSPNCSKYKTC
jgi:hypothetical protein